MIISIPVIPLIGGIMSDDENDSVKMAECGACRTVIPLDSKECPECQTKFSGVSEEALGECGACNKLVPLDSTRCPECGVVFVADDVVDILRNWVNNTGVDIRKLFDRFDENSDGMIDTGELKRGLLSLNLADLPLTQVERLVKEIDRDENGLIDLDEFEVILTGSHDPSMDEHQESDEGPIDEEAEVDVDLIDDGSEEADQEEIDEEQANEDESDEDEDDESSTDDDSDGNDEDLEAEMDEEDFELEEEEVKSEFHSPLYALADLMDQHDISAQRLFNDLDKDGNGLFSLTELVAVINEKYSDLIDIKEVEGIMNKMDSDGDGMIDLIEFTESMESVEDEEEGEEKEFPTPMQRRMMSKSWNDAVWPLIHTGFGIMIVLLLVNALFGPVDGSGGMVEYSAKDPSTIIMGDDNVQLTEGMVYACDPIYQKGECSNSLTPFSGESSSMPKGFYLDGIIFTVLGIAGLLGSLITHLAIVPSWRARARAMKEVNEDKEEAEQIDSDDDDSESEDEEGENDLEDEESYDDEDDAGDDDSNEEPDEDEEDDPIDIGSHVGLTFDDEEIFGTILEFDDDEGTVTIKEDGTGDEVTGYQEDMFVE